MPRLTGSASEAQGHLMDCRVRIDKLAVIITGTAESLRRIREERTSELPMLAALDRELEAVRQTVVEGNQHIGFLLGKYETLLKMMPALADVPELLDADRE